jgi:hypothetical protein
MQLIQLIPAMVLSSSSLLGATPWDEHGALEVSPDGRRVQHADGADWFWLGDTAWDLFAVLTRGDTELYLENRRAKGFSVIQAVVVMGYHLEWNKANAYGHRPFVDGDPAQPDAAGTENFWTHVDFVVESAAEKGMYMALLPSWGSFITGEGGDKVSFTAENAVTYARWIAERYKDCPNIIWVNGGDTRGALETATWNAVGEAIKEICPKHLQTYHPRGGSDSSMWFHEKKWLDFNMFQSGHHERDNRNDQMADRIWAKSPAKPVLDGEPCYEKHPINWKMENPSFDDQDVRQAAYWSLFAGSFGHTYGHVNMWCFNTPGKMPSQTIFVAMDHALDWKGELDSLGAFQMGHVRKLMDSRPQRGRIPMQNLLVGNYEAERKLRATRGNGYAFIYTSRGDAIKINLDKLSWNLYRAWWFNPRSGSATGIEDVVTGGQHTFTPPGTSGRGNDWVLVIDDKAREYAAPGASDKR